MKKHHYKRKKFTSLNEMMDDIRRREKGRWYTIKRTRYQVHMFPAMMEDKEIQSCCMVNRLEYSVKRRNPFSR